MIKVVRVIVYETRTQEDMDEQIGRSMPDGLKQYGRNGQTIRIYTLRGSFLRRLWDLIKRLR